MPGRFRVCATSRITPDTTPNQFTFADQTNVALSTIITSAPVTITGINSPTPCSISGGGAVYDINSSGSFTSSPGIVNNGDTVRVRLTSSASNSTPTTGTFTAGGVSDGFTATTLSAGGAIVDDDLVILPGPAASLPTFSEWLGGASGVIQAGTVGSIFTRPNWSPLGPGSTYRYANARTFSRSKTIVFDTTVNLHYAGTQFLDHGVSGFVDLYSSANFYCETPGAVSNFQWKIKRCMPNLSIEGNPEPDVVDGINPSWYISRYKTWTESFINIYNEDAATVRWHSANQTWPMNRWFRLETWMTRNNPVASANGLYRIKVTNLDDASVPCLQTFSDIKFRGPLATLPHRFDTFQNYCGNADDFGYPNTWGDTKIFMEDIWSASHSSSMDGSGQVRAELVNNAVYNSATKRAICKVESIDGSNNWAVRLNGAQTYFGVSDLTGLYVAMFPASGTPTMRQL